MKSISSTVDAFAGPDQLVSRTLVIEEDPMTVRCPLGAADVRTASARMIEDIAALRHEAMA